ncbi:MAG: 1-aminocyclopropane-1-carboxylate deaminase/D-cysteine desulfhydrase, partial [Ignavibacteriaceae bacterium]
YHFGGYAKVNSTLINFCIEFYSKHKIEIEPIYTGKMFYGIYELIKNDFFPKHSSIIAVHTGGLQGLNGLKFRKLINK